MNGTIDLLISQLKYLFTNITMINILDIFLVAGFFFVIFQALYQTRAMQLLRGAIIIAILGISLFLVLPLQTFTLLLQGLLIAGLIALPILFQDELRRGLTGLGQIGTRRDKESAFDQLKSTLLTATEQFSNQRNGALIVLEGQTPLNNIIETGVTANVERITPELLITIFFPNTPLHDGAVVLRGDRLMAAGCTLPVLKEQTETERLGTRHRAALGLSFQVPDALVIIVSEETGDISVAKDGKIYRGLKLGELEGWLKNFQHQVETQPRIRWGWLRSGGIKIILTNLIVALSLAIVAWVSISIQTNPPKPNEIEDIPLIIIPPPPELIVTSEIQDKIAVNLQTTDEIAENLDSNSITAELDLSGLGSGGFQVPVEVSFAISGVQLISVDPANINVTTEPIISLELRPEPDPKILGSPPIGYKYGEISISPETVIVQGPASLVSKVLSASFPLQLDGKRTDFQQILPVTLLDQYGDIFDELTPSPKQILVDVKIEQEFETRVVAVQANINPDTLETGYQITSQIPSPDIVTLKGSRSGLAKVGDFVMTAPITLTGVYSELSTNVPLILPDGVEAINEQEAVILSVTVRVTVDPIIGYLRLNYIEVEERGLDPSLSSNVGENTVNALLSGPQYLLDEVVTFPYQLIVYVDLNGLSPGVHRIPIQYEVPEGILVELFPSETEVTITENP